MAKTWKRLRDVVTVANDGDQISQFTFDANDYLKVVFFIKKQGTGDMTLFPNAVTSGSNTFTARYGKDFGSFTSNNNHIGIHGNYGQLEGDCLATYYISNKSGEEKLILWEYALGASGDNAPDSFEASGKYTTKTGQITSFSANCGSGGFGAGTWIAVYGIADDTVTDEKTTLTNIPLNTRYEEVDTRKIYRAVEKLDVSDDLTTDKGWNSNSNDFTYNATNYSIDLSPLRRNTTSQQIYIDVQDSDYLNGNNLSDTSFIFRFGKIRWNTVPAGGGVTANIMLSKGLQDSGTNQYSVNLQQILNSSEAITRARANDGSTNNEGNSTSVQSFSSTYTPNESNIYRWEIVRDGNDFAFKVYAENDSSYNTPLETKTVTATGITDLRYILITNDSEQTNSTTADMEILGNIDIYNGTTTTTGVNWKERGVA